MTQLTITPSHTPPTNINNGGALKYKKSNPLKDFIANDQDGKVKRAALIGSAISTTAFLFAAAKISKKGAFKIKDMVNIDFEKKGAIKAILLATSAVIGGLTGGLITDKKENRKPKVKEAIHQFLGNIITPITIVGIATDQIKKRGYSKLKNGLLGGVAAIVGVAAGVTGGNWIASRVNEKIFKENDGRKVGIKDFGIHVDDILTVMALSDLGEKVQSFTSKALPIVFLICGYEAGTKKLEKSEEAPSHKK